MQVGVCVPCENASARFHFFRMNYSRILQDIYCQKKRPLFVAQTHDFIFSQEELKKRREQEEQHAKEQEFLRTSIRGSKKLQALESGREESPVSGFVNDAYDDVDEDRIPYPHPRFDASTSLQKPVGKFVVTLLVFVYILLLFTALCKNCSSDVTSGDLKVFRFLFNVLTDGLPRIYFGIRSHSACSLVKRQTNCQKQTQPFLFGQFDVWIWILQMNRVV